MSYQQFSEPQEVFKKGNQWVMRPAKQSAFRNLSSTELGMYDNAVKAISDANGDATKQMKLLKYYSQLWDLTKEESVALAKAAKMNVINKNNIDSVMKEVCEAMFARYVQMNKNDYLNMTEDDWKEFKTAEFKKIIKQGIADVYPKKPITTVAVVTVSKDNASVVKTDINPNEAYDNDDLDKLNKLLTFINKGLEKCLKEYLKGQGQTKIGEYQRQDDGRRRRSFARGRHSDGKRHHSRKHKRSVRYDGGRSKSKGKGRRRSVRFDGVSLKKWVQKMRNSRKSRKSRK